MPIRMARHWEVMVSIALIAGLLVACSAKTAPGEGALGASSQPVHISYWIPLNGNAAPVIKNMGDVPMVQEWEKRTHVNITFQHPTGSSRSDIMQQLGVLLASKNLPDVIETNWKGFAGGPSKLYNDGVIVKLNELINKDAPNLKKILADYPDVAKQISADNGDIYVFPQIRVGKYGQYSTFAGLMIRQDWLDQLGLKAPETIDEWEIVLKAFKEKKGAIPISFTSSSIPGTIGSNDFMGAFGMSNSFYLHDGKVLYAPLQPAFKEYLGKMQQWYKEGLIDPDFASNDDKALNAKITSGKVGAFFGYIGSSMGTYLPALQKNDPLAALSGVQYPVLNKGDEPQFTVSTWNYDSTGAVITRANKHPDETIKALDYLFSDEGSLLKNFGIEGQTYQMVNGQPQYTDLILKNPDNLPIGQAMAKYFIANYPFIGMPDDRYNLQYYPYDAQKEALQTYSIFSQNAFRVMLPPVTLPPDEANEFAKIMSDIETYRSEVVTRIIMGASPLSDFDRAVEQIKSMNIDRAIAIEQAAVDRYNNR